MIKSLYSERPSCVFFFLGLLSNFIHWYEGLHTVGPQNPQPSWNLCKKEKSVNTKLPINAQYDSCTQFYRLYPCLLSLDWHSLIDTHGPDSMAMVLPGLTSPPRALSPTLHHPSLQALTSRHRSLVCWGRQQKLGCLDFHLNEDYTLKSKYQKKTTRMKKESLLVKQKWNIKQNKIPAEKRTIASNKLQSSGHVYKGHRNMSKCSI